MDLSATYNLAFQFAPDSAQKLAAYSQSLNEIIPTSYCLGIDSFPHVTLVQFRIDLPSEENLPSIWQKTRTLLTQPLTLLFDGLTLIQSGGLIWFASRVKRTRSLEILQKEALFHLKSCRIENKTDDQYDPHATLAAWPIFKQIPSFPLCPNFLTTWEAPVRLMLGKSGSQGQFTEILFSE